MENDKVIMGRVASPYGLRGWCKVVSFTQPIENLGLYPIWKIKHQGQWQEFRVEAFKTHGKLLVAHLEGFDDRTKASHFTNDLIAVDRSALRPLQPNEYYWIDLIGLTVINSDGSHLGHITSLSETGANDVIVITDENKHELLLPYIPQVVKSVDLVNKVMTVDWQGYFE